MSSYVDMSLEDIIKKKRETTRVQRKKQNVSVPHKPVHVTDARNKIISKKRTQITDAREKLAQLAKQKDARLKLEKLRLERLGAQGQPRNCFPNRGKYARTVPNKEILKERVFTDSSRQVVSQPLHIAKVIQNRKLNVGRQFNSSRQLNTSKHLNTWRQFNTASQPGPARQLSNAKHFNRGRFVDGRLIEKTRFDASIREKPKPILRTVENDLEIIDDPMEDEYVPPKVSSNSLNRLTSLQLKIVAHNDDIHERGITTVHRSAITEKERSPPRPPSILKKRPMAALRSDTKTVIADKTSMEFRIIVSNLRNTVTAGDIKELFGDVGGMLESRLVRPGTAEVIYKTQEDAQKAVDLYHNRQLDGQPMNCLLVTPRAPVTTARNSTKPALYSTNSNVEPDISTFHKVLFSNL